MVEGTSGAVGRRLLVVGAGPAQIGVLEAARRRGLDVVAADRNPGAPGFPLASRRALISTEDELALDRLASAERVDGIVSPGTDFPVAIAARIAARLGIAHPIAPATAQAATSKLRQRERFRAAGVPHVRHETCSSLDEAREAVARIGLPCVVKAPDRQGQRGLAVVREERELGQALARVAAEARGNVVLVEELVEGPELTVNAFSVDGAFHPLTVTDRVRAEPPGFGVALAHVWPSEQSGDVVGDVVDVARRAAAAIGLADGPSYTQVLVGPAGARVCEIAARVGGGHDAELCAVATGVDLNDLALSAALGEPVEPDRLAVREPAGGACIRFLVAPAGRLRAIEGAEEAAELDGIVWVRAYREPGHVFGVLRTGADRAGAVLAVGADRAEAVARAAAAAQRVRFLTVEPEPTV